MPVKNEIEKRIQTAYNIKERLVTKLGVITNLEKREVTQQRIELIDVANERRIEFEIQLGRCTGVKNTVEGYRRKNFTKEDRTALENLHNPHAWPHQRRVIKWREILARRSRIFTTDPQYDRFLVASLFFATDHDTGEVFTGEKIAHEKLGVLYSVASLSWVRDQINKDLPVLARKYSKDVKRLSRMTLSDIPDTIEYKEHFNITSEDRAFLALYGQVMSSSGKIGQRERESFVQIVRKYEKAKEALEFQLTNTPMEEGQRSEIIKRLKAVKKALKYSYYVEAGQLLSDLMLHDIATLINYHSEPEETVLEQDEKGGMRRKGLTETMVKSILPEPRGINMRLIDLGEIFDAAVQGAIEIQQRRGINTKIEQETRQGIQILSKVFPQIRGHRNIYLPFLWEAVLKAKTQGLFLGLSKENLQKLYVPRERGETHADRLHRTLLLLCALPDKLDQLHTPEASNIRTSEFSLGKRPFFTEISAGDLKNIKGNLTSDEGELLVRAARSPQCDIDRSFHELMRSYQEIIPHGEEWVTDLISEVLGEKAQALKIIVEAMTREDFQEWDAYFDKRREYEMKVLAREGRDERYKNVVKRRMEAARKRAKEVILEKRKTLPPDFDYGQVIKLIDIALVYINKRRLNIPGLRVDPNLQFAYYGGRECPPF